MTNEDHGLWLICYTALLTHTDMSDVGLFALMRVEIYHVSEAFATIWTPRSGSLSAVFTQEVSKGKAVPLIR